MAHDTLLTYLDFNEAFTIHINNSTFQLGAVLVQKVKPIAFYSIKLFDAQQRYTVTDRQLISIVETLKYFRTILLGKIFRINTDHKNLTCNNFNTDLILEEYGPGIEYITGKKNIVAYGLSRIPLNGNQETTQNSTYQLGIVSEINYIKEISEGTSPINLKLFE